MFSRSNVTVFGLVLKHVERIHLLLAKIAAGANNKNIIRKEIHTFGVGFLFIIW